MDEMLLQRIMRHEGAVTRNGSHVAYKGSQGKETIGYGTLIDFPGGLSQIEARFLLQNRIASAGAAAKQSYPGFTGLDTDRQGVIVEMVFQLGLEGVLKFKKMIAATVAGNYDGAADQMVQSAWDQETPSRVDDLAAIMRG